MIVEPSLYNGEVDLNAEGSQASQKPPYLYTWYSVCVYVDVSKFNLNT